MASNYYSIETILEITEITQVLARYDIEKNTIFKSGTRMPDFWLPQWLYTERKSLQFLYDNYPNDTRIPTIATYVLSLCGNYVGRALQYLGSGTGIPINPSTGQPLSLEVYRNDFIVDGSPASDFPITAGDSTYTIALSNIIKKSVDWYPSGVLESIGITDRATINSVIYTKDYAILNFNQAVQSGEAYTVKALRSATGTSSAGGTTNPIPLPLKRGQFLSNDGTILLWTDPFIEITSDDFESDGITYINTILNDFEFSLFLNDVDRFLDPTEPAVEFTRIDSGGFTINLSGFNANSNTYTIKLFKKGISDA